MISLRLSGRFFFLWNGCPHYRLPVHFVNPIHSVRRLPRPALSSPLLSDFPLFLSIYSGLLHLSNRQINRYQQNMVI